MKFLLIFLTLFQVQVGWSQEKEIAPAEPSLIADLKESFGLLIKASYGQFTVENNAYYLVPAVGTTWYAFEEDDRFAALTQSKEIKNIVDHVGDAGVVFNFPLLHAGWWYYGKKTKSTHAMQFAKEYFAAMYLTLAESGLLSYVQVHERPSKDNISFWEKEFRGDSSWPSGHIVPYSTLFFKTMQFYGPYWSLIPLSLTVMSSIQRMQDGKHFLSDVVGAFWLSAFASEGVRAAAQYKKNHSFYKWVFEREARLSIIRHRNAIGPRVVWNF